MTRLVLVLFLVATLAAPVAPPAPSDPIARVSPILQQALAGGGQAEMLVVLRAQADLAGAGNLQGKAAKGRFVRDALWDTAERGQAGLRHWLDAQGATYRVFYIINALLVRGDAQLLHLLSLRTDVAAIEANPQVKMREEPSGPPSLAPSAAQGIEPGIARVRAPEMWSLGFTGQGIVIGGQDTGYDWEHPALRAHYRGVQGASVDHNYNWHDAIHVDNTRCLADSLAPCDDQGHGTHTMGIAVGSDGAANQVGMAPGAKWIGCRNMDGGRGTPASYLECFEFFLAPYPIGGGPENGDPAKAPDVTTNSWSCPGYEGCSWETLQAAVEAQRAAGIFTVVSAGNGGPDCSTVTEPPGLYDASYSVGAVDASFAGSEPVATFSSRGPVTADLSNRLKPDIVAPGVQVRSSWPGGFYIRLDGTSMAAPHVAGAVALLWSARPDLRDRISPTEMVLNASAVRTVSAQCPTGASESPVNPVYGFGRLDVRAAFDTVPFTYFLPLLLR